MPGRAATLREVLNRLRWDPTAAGEVVFAYRERRDGVECLAERSFAATIEIGIHGLALADGVFLPYHRIVIVRAGDTVVWRRPEGPE